MAVRAVLLVLTTVGTVALVVQLVVHDLRLPSGRTAGSTSTTTPAAPPLLVTDDPADSGWVRFAPYLFGGDLAFAPSRKRPTPAVMSEAAGPPIASELQTAHRSLIAMRPRG